MKALPRARRRAVLPRQFRHDLDRRREAQSCAPRRRLRPAAMDALLLLAPTTGSIGYAGRGDFAMAPDGRLATRPNARWCLSSMPAPRSCARAFRRRARGAFSLTPLFDRAARAERLHGLRLDGVWMHVGTPEAMAAKRKPRFVASTRHQLTGTEIRFACCQSVYAAAPNWP